MSSRVFVQGLVIGFSIAAPVGPIGVLCIRRSIADGRWIGFATGLGAATADAAYGCVAAFGLTAIADLLVAQKSWLGLIGGAFLCWLGMRTISSRAASDTVEGQRANAAGAFASTLAFTLTNPMTILSFIAVFAGIGLGATTNFARASTLVAGVFTGSAAWWLVLSTCAATLRSAIDATWLKQVNRISGVVILGFGLWALAYALR